MYKSKYKLIPGTDYEEIIRNTRKEQKKIQSITKRQPYVRSKYFKGDKIFINPFFTHLFQKRRGDQQRRAKLFLCAVDLLRNTESAPETIVSKVNKNEELHRFIGKSKDGQLFYVQVKQNKRTGRKDFMSAFPVKNTRN